MSIGELVVVVPTDAHVLVAASVGLGELTIDGVTIRNDASPTFAGALPGGSPTGPAIDLPVRTNVGSLEVSRA